MSDFLKTMAAGSRARAAEAPRFTARDFDKPVVPLKLGAFDVIAEIKQRSPAEGKLGTGHPISKYGTGHPISDAKYGVRYRISGVAERAQAYAAGGAVAISVLTEPSRFDGDLAHLAEVVAAVPGTPVMRKDFLVDPVQVQEARKAGASGVLLIATMLSDASLRAMLDCAWEHDLFVLLESFDEDDLARSARLLDNAADAERAAAGQFLIGVNTRNLRSLEVDATRLERLAPLLPAAQCVAESGLVTADDATLVAGWGYSLALVGTALMRSDDPGELIRAMREAGAAACS